MLGNSAISVWIRPSLAQDRLATVCPELSQPDLQPELENRG